VSQLAHLGRAKPPPAVRIDAYGALMEALEDVDVEGVPAGPRQLRPSSAAVAAPVVKVELLADADTQVAHPAVVVHAAAEAVLALSAAAQEWATHVQSCATAPALCRCPPWCWEWGVRRVGVGASLVAELRGLRLRGRLPRALAPTPAATAAAGPQPWKSGRRLEASLRLSRAQARAMARWYLVRLWGSATADTLELARRRRGETVAVAVRRQYRQYRREQRPYRFRRPMDWHSLVGGGVSLLCRMLVGLEAVSVVEPPWLQFTSECQQL
jgi:hypothetical protein